LTNNPTWGAPRFHGELLLLEFETSEPRVSRYLQGLKGFPQESQANIGSPLFLGDHLKPAIRDHLKGSSADLVEADDLDC
jgi:hypothetical protein